MVQIHVAPLTGAWIEMQGGTVNDLAGIVAPLTGAWIEIYKNMLIVEGMPNVAPLTGAWIEI